MMVFEGRLLMKKIVIGGIIICLIVVGSIGGYYLLKKKPSDDALKFKAEYEALNSELNEDGTSKYTPLTINEYNQVVYLTYEELLTFIESGSGILYFGRPGCPWCRLLVPILLDFGKNQKENIYYYNIEKDREENNEQYKNILSIFHEYLPIDTVNQKEGDKKFDHNLKRVILPQLFFIKDGVIKSDLYAYQHEYLKDDNKSEMTDLLLQKYDMMKDENVKEAR